MTEARLKELLQDLATEAPPSSTIRAEQLHQHIGRRRKNRVLGAGAAAMSVAVAMAAAVVGLQWFGSGADSTSPASDGDERRGYVRITGDLCGGRVTETGRPWLRVTGTFPAKVSLPAEYKYPRDRELSGTVTFTNVSERARHMWASARSVVVQGGVVVGVPREFQVPNNTWFALWPGGTSHPIDTGVVVKDCRHKSTLKPGIYDLYVGVPNTHVWSGPWRFELSFY